MSEFKILKKITPNKSKGRNGWKPDMIVSHITEGSFNGAVSWLCNPDSGASSHFVVAKDGRITQLVELEDTSWCNGTSTDLVKKPNLHYSKSTLAKVRDRKTNANYYTVSIEHEGFSTEGKGRLEPKQLEATIWLHKHIRAEVNRIYGVEIPLDRNHIVGHYQINPITKPFCPGANFQFEEVIKQLKGADIVGSVFKDVDDNRWSFEFIKKAAELGIIVGDDKGNFNPIGPLTREQAAVIAVRIVELTKGGK